MGLVKVIITPTTQMVVDSESGELIHGVLKIDLTAMKGNVECVLHVIPTVEIVCEPTIKPDPSFGIVKLQDGRYARIAE